VLFEGSKCEMSRRTFAVKGIVASGVSVAAATLTAEAQPSSKGVVNADSHSSVCVCGFVECWL